VEKGQKHKVCLLLKTIYGLKQVGRVWYTRIDDFFHNQGLTRNESNHNLYYSIWNNQYVVLILYVDDMLLTSGDITNLHELEDQLS
jgi:hypothetical protein